MHLKVFESTELECQEGSENVEADPEMERGIQTRRDSLGELLPFFIFFVWHLRRNT